MRRTLFTLLRLYVAFEQSTFGKWLLGRKVDVVLEPLPRNDETVPEVHDAPSLYVSGDGRSAYMHQGSTLRRVAMNENDELVYIHKATKRERRAAKRAKRVHGATA